MNGEYISLSKGVLFLSFLILIACFLPWWTLCTTSGTVTYLVISIPFFQNWHIELLFVPIGTGIIPGNPGTLDGLINWNIQGSFYPILAVIISLLGGILGILSFGKKEITRIAGALVVAGTLIYIILIAFRILPPGVDATFYTSEGITPLFGIITSNIAPQFQHIFGVSLGCYLTLCFGILLILISYKSSDH